MAINSGASQKYWGGGKPFGGLSVSLGVSGMKFFQANFLIPEGQSIEVTAAGGYVFGATAVIEATRYSQTLSVVALGGYTLSGTAAVVREVVFEFAGGLIFGGEGITSANIDYEWDARGGVVFSGVAGFANSGSFIGSGSLYFGGLAGIIVPSDDQYVFDCPRSEDDVISLACQTENLSSAMDVFMTVEAIDADSEWR